MAKKSLIPIEVPADAYDVTGWNGNLEVPTKNAVRDKINSVSNNIAFPMTFTPFDHDTDVAVGVFKYSHVVPAHLNGATLDDALAMVRTQGVTGSTDVRVWRRRSGTAVAMISTDITIGAEYYANDGVINTSNDDVQTGDEIYIEVIAVHSGTAPKGLSVTLTFKL